MAGGVAEGVAAYGADELFELRHCAGVESPMAGIVGTRRHFVRDKLAVGRHEKLYGEQTDKIEGVGYTPGYGAGPIEELRGYSGRHRRAV